MECHRRLAELGKFQAASSRLIAQQLARELGEAPGRGDPPTEEYEIPSRRGSPKNRLEIGPAELLWCRISPLSRLDL